MVVIVDGMEAGLAPWSGELTPGRHTFALRTNNRKKVKTQDFNVNVMGRSMTVPINVADPSIF